MTTPPALDYGVSERQAIGSTYARPAKLESLIERYRRGSLGLPPHPEWSGDFTDWSANPYNDRNWQFQHHTLRWINPLRWAALEGDIAAREEWARVARSWFEANVPAERAVGFFAWKDMADGNRAVQLSLGAPLIPNGAEWFVELLNAHRDWLIVDEHIAGGNHGLHQNIGLLVVGAVLRDGTATSKARDRMVESFEDAFNEEGYNEEGSTAYHQMNIRWWREGWKRVATEGLEVPPHVTARLDAACTILAQLAQPDGELPQIGDGRRARLLPRISEVTDYVESDSARGKHPGATALVVEGGYALSRSGWGDARPMSEESHTLVRHGRFNRGHGHFDSGSVHIYAAGRRWLTDPGFHSYQTGDATRRYLASRAAHNVPLLADLERDESQPFELISARTTDVADDFLLRDHGWGAAQLQRRVTYLRGPDCWIVWDRVRSERDVVLRQHWQTEVGVTARYRHHGFRLFAGDRSLSMTWLGGTSQLRRHDAVDGDLTGWVGTAWKTLEKATRITATAAGRTPQMATLIGAHSPATFGAIDSYIAGGNLLTATLVRGGSEWAVAIDDDSVKVNRR